MSYTNLLLKGFCNMYQKMAALKYDLCALFFGNQTLYFLQCLFFLNSAENWIIGIWKNFKFFLLLLFAGDLWSFVVVCDCSQLVCDHLLVVCSSLWGVCGGLLLFAGLLSLVIIACFFFNSMCSCCLGSNCWLWCCVIILDFFVKTYCRWTSCGFKEIKNFSLWKQVLLKLLNKKIIRWKISCSPKRVILLGFLGLFGK